MRLVATYVGGMDGAVTPCPSGRAVTGYRGEPVEILESERETLAAHPEWIVEEQEVQELAASDSPAQHEQETS